jgi:hypothetical protein
MSFRFTSKRANSATIEAKNADTLKAAKMQRFFVAMALCLTVDLSAEQKGVTDWTFAQPVWSLRDRTLSMRGSLKCRMRIGRIQTTSSETTHGPASFRRTGLFSIS